MRNKEYCFSVLMSVYYKELPEYLKDSLLSVINQSLRPDEIVLVKDGKLTPELDKVISDFKKKYPRLFTIVPLKKNSGLGIALNAGLNHCKYDIIARMDSDDYSLPDRFEKQINVFKNRNVDMVGGLIQEYDEEMAEKQGIRTVPENHESILKYLKKRSAFNHVSVMYRKQAVIDAGGYQDCPYFEDYYLWCRMAKKNCLFYNIQEVLVNVRGGDSMINRRGGKEYNKCIRNFYDKIYKIGFVNLFEKKFNTALRVFISSNFFIRKIIYKHYLRK